MHFLINFSLPVCVVISEIAREQRRNQCTRAGGQFSSPYLSWSVGLSAVLQSQHQQLHKCQLSPLGLSLLTSVSVDSETCALFTLPSRASRRFFSLRGANGQRGLAVEKYNRALQIDRCDFVFERPLNNSLVMHPLFGGVNGRFRSARLVVLVVFVLLSC